MIGWKGIKPILDIIVTRIDDVRLDTIRSVHRDTKSDISPNL